MAVTVGCAVTSVPTAGRCGGRAGGRPRLLSGDDEDFVIQTATTRPTKLGQPFTRWSIRKLAAYQRRVRGRVIRISREALRCLLLRRGISFQRTKTWKESRPRA
jgi:transposase